MSRHDERIVCPQCREVFRDADAYERHREWGGNEGLVVCPREPVPGNELVMIYDGVEHYAEPDSEYNTRQIQ